MVGKDTDFIDIEAAGKEYGWSVPMLYKFRKQGRLTFYSIAGKRGILLKRSELDALALPQPK